MSAVSKPESQQAYLGVSNIEVIYDHVILVLKGVSLSVQDMEGRNCFAHLTVEENLLTGAYTRTAGRAQLKQDLERVYGYFPQLKERRGALAGYTSGGEQQMTALRRALM